MGAVPYNPCCLPVPFRVLPVAACLTRQQIQRLPGRKIQAQQLAGAVDELTGGDVGGTADFFTVDVSRRAGTHQQQPCGAAGQVPGQQLPAQQIHSPGGPEYRGDVALLVREAVQGHMEGRGQDPGLGLPRQEAGHIGALHGSGAGADAHSPDRSGVQLRKEPVGELRQALYMREQGLRLAQTQGARLHRQQPGAIDALLTVIGRHGGGVVAGVEAQADHALGS